MKTLTIVVYTYDIEEIIEFKKIKKDEVIRLYNDLKIKYKNIEDVKIYFIINNGEAKTFEEAEDEI